MANEQVFIEKAETALTFLQGIEFDQAYDDPKDTRKFWEYYNDAHGILHELLNRYKAAVTETGGLPVLLETHEKVSITPKAMPLTQAVRLFESLTPTGRQAFYKSLTDDERDALYTEVTNNQIARVPLTTKNRIDARTNKARQQRRGYLLPDECHIAENECLWRSAAWYHLLGHVNETLRTNLSHMREHFDAFGEVAEA